jgi:hypothetical protein
MNAQRAKKTRPRICEISRGCLRPDQKSRQRPFSKASSFSSERISCVLGQILQRGAVLAAHISLNRLGVSAPSFHAKARHMIHRPVNAHLGRLVPEPCAARNSSRWQFCDHGALAPPPHYGFALTAYRETAAAFETLSDPNSPKKGILTKWSHNSRVRSRNPGPSAPRTKARGRSRY